MPGCQIGNSKEGNGGVEQSWVGEKEVCYIQGNACLIRASEDIVN